MRAKILIVEDNIFTAESVQSTLISKGYRVEMANSPKEAIDLSKAFEPNLILMDIDLKSNMDGIELASKINQLRQTPIIYLTDKQDERIVQKAANVHHAYYMTKPFNEAILLSQVEFVLRQSSANNPKVSVRALFVKDKSNSSGKRKIDFDAICYLKAARSYCELYVQSGNGSLEKLEASRNMGEVLQKLPQSQFIQVHRSYAVNIERIDSFDTTDMVVCGVPVPIGESFKPTVLELLNQV